MTEKKPSSPSKTEIENSMQYDKSMVIGDAFAYIQVDVKTFSE